MGMTANGMVARVIILVPIFFVAFKVLYESIELELNITSVYKSTDL